jgi:hypothetical protein
VSGVLYRRNSILGQYKRRKIEGTEEYIERSVRAKIISGALYGRSVQARAPTLDTPALARVSENIILSASGAGRENIVSGLPVLRGIPVPAGSAYCNHIDRHGAGWCCDTLDLATGEFTRRVAVKALTGVQESYVEDYQAMGNPPFVGAGVLKFYVRYSMESTSNVQNVHSICSHYPRSAAAAYCEEYECFSLRYFDGGAPNNLNMYIYMNILQERVGFQAGEPQASNVARIRNYFNGLYLSGNPVTFLYPRDVPSAEHADLTRVLETYSKGTQVRVDAECIPYFKIHALSY